MKEKSSLPTVSHWAWGMMIGIRNFSLAAGLALAVFAPPHYAAASGFSVFHTFKGQDDGEFPEAGVIADRSGNLYGTTFGTLESGARGKKCPKSCGNIYGFTPGEVQTLTFFFQDNKDGAFPTGEVLLKGEMLYGTTEYGPGTGCGGLGCGTAYQIRTNGTKEKVFVFCHAPDCADGAIPHGALIADKQGNLYGITTVGGTGNGFLCGSNLGGCGVVYEITRDGVKSVLYSFCGQPNCADGANPLGGLLIDKDGNLYGTTQFGGAHSGGTVFKLTPNGEQWSETVLYSFCAQMQDDICTDGAVPEAGLVADRAGNLYGTAAIGGVTSCGGDPGCGVAFKLAPNGAYTVLHQFLGGDDGVLPQAPLIADGSGNLYGTTARGGGGGPCPHDPVGCGTVFALAMNGAETILHAFTTKTDGADPEGALLLENGSLFGATREKGDHKCACGTIFEIDIQSAMQAGSRGLPLQPPGAGDRRRR